MTIDQAAGLLIQRTDDERILLVLRSDYVNDPGIWGLPGGHLEEGEDEVNAAFREATEELGPLPESIAVVGCWPYISPEFPYTTFYAMIDGDDAHVWAPTLNWENDAVEWFSLDALPENTHSGVLDALEAMNV